jgi:catalase
MKAERERRGVAVFFFTLGARWGWVVNGTSQRLYPRE